MACFTHWLFVGIAGAAVGAQFGALSGAGADAGS